MFLNVKKLLEGWALKVAARSGPSNLAPNPYRCGRQPNSDCGQAFQLANLNTSIPGNTKKIEKQSSSIATETQAEGIRRTN